MTTHIGFRASPSFKKWLKDLADEAGFENVSEFIKYTLSNYATDVPDTVDDERLLKYQKTVAEEMEDKIDRRIAKARKRKYTIHQYISGVALDMLLKNVNAEDIIDTLEASRPMFERKNQEDKLDAVIKAVKEDNTNYLKNWADWYEEDSDTGRA